MLSGIATYLLEISHLHRRSRLLFETIFCKGFAVHTSTEDAASYNVIGIRNSMRLKNARKCVGAMLFLFFAHVSMALAQTPTIGPRPIELTEKQKTEIRAFAKRFLKQMRETRDVRPLLSEYFTSDFDTFFWTYLLSDAKPASGTKREALTASERRRIAITELNYMAVLGSMWVVEDFETRLPPPLRIRVKKFMNAADGGDEWLNTRRGVRDFIKRFEILHRDLVRFLKQHPIEKDTEYIQQVTKREKIDDYNYSILVDVPERNADQPAATWLRARSNEPAYMVGTPIGLCVGIIRVKGIYKVIYVMPWPISYDGRIK